MKASARRYARKSAFLEFCERDGLAVITGYGVDDLKTAPLKHWERWGGPAAYCHLEGSQVSSVSSSRKSRPARALNRFGTCMKSRC